MATNCKALLLLVNFQGFLLCHIKCSSLRKQSISAGTISRRHSDGDLLRFHSPKWATKRLVSCIVSVSFSIQFRTAYAKTRYILWLSVELQTWQTWAWVISSVVVVVLVWSVERSDYLLAFGFEWMKVYSAVDTILYTFPDLATQ